MFSTLKNARKIYLHLLLVSSSRDLMMVFKFSITHVALRHGRYVTYISCLIIGRFCCQFCCLFIPLETLALNRQNIDTMKYRLAVISPGFFFDIRLIPVNICVLEMFQTRRNAGLVVKTGNSESQNKNIKMEK